MSVRKVTGLPLPETPSEAPVELHRLVDAIEQNLAESRTVDAALALGHCFEYLTRYFAAVAGAAANALGLPCSSQVSADFESARLNLKERLTLLGEMSTDPLSKLVRSVFFVGATRKTPTPRRHARLLELGGIPIRGYLRLEDWVKLQPGEGALSDETKANRELLRYLPILKEWMTATSSYFLDTKQLSVRWEEDGLHLDLDLLGKSCSAGPVELPEGLRHAFPPPTAQASPDPPISVSEVASEAPSQAISQQPEIPAQTITEKPEIKIPQTQVLEGEALSAGPAPPPQAVSEQTGGQGNVTEPPKIEVMGLEPEISEGTTTSPAAQTIALKADEIAPLLENSVDLPGAEGATPEGDSNQAKGFGNPAPDVSLEPAVAPEPSVVTDSLSTPLPVPMIAELPTEKEPSLRPQENPSVEEMSDPVIAALNPLSQASFVGSSSDTLVYPMVDGPPPEYFDEVAVESDCPEVLAKALNDLNGAIESNDATLICGQMQRCLDLMIQFFAGLAGAILNEIDPDSLLDFDVDESRFDIEQKVELMVHSLSCLEEYWENQDAANLLWCVFYDTLLPATDPNYAYLHTRLLGVEGLVPDGYLEFTELCALVPGHGELATQAQCREISHRYLPVLNFWLENAMALFLESEVDFVEEDDDKALSWASTAVGTTLDGTPSGFWVEVDSSRWNLPKAELAPIFVSGEAPDVLLPVFDALNTALENQDIQKAGVHLRVSLDFLIQYFAGCTASLWRQQGRMTEQALELFSPEASLLDKERLLILALGGVSTSNDTGLGLTKIFSKNSLQFRCLAQRDQPPGVGSVSEWAASRENVSEAEILAYLPLLRSWIGAANPWFAGGEQLFEEPTEGGILEGVVAHGDEFLEIVDPEYIIRLAPECMQLVLEIDEEPELESEPEREESEFKAEIPPLTTLEKGPKVLVGHVERLHDSWEDKRASNAWLGASFEYLIQYFGGLCRTVLGDEVSKLPSDVSSYYNPKASLREKELLLVACVDQLKKTAAPGVQQSVRDIFIAADGSDHLHTKCLGSKGAGSLGDGEMLLSFWSRLRHQQGTMTHEDRYFGTTILNSWLEAAKPFFAICDHYAEDPGTDGLEEMVVELAEDYLDMVLPDYAIQIPARGYYEVLYRESDAQARSDVESYFPEDVRPELMGPQEAVLGGIASDGEEEELLGAAVELGGGDDLFAGAPGAVGDFDADELFSGSAGGTAPTVSLNLEEMFTGPAEQAKAKQKATTPVPELVPEAAPGHSNQSEEVANPAPPVLSERRKRKKKKSKKKELGSAVLKLYKKERLEKARKRAEARAKKLEVEPTRLKYDLEYRGLKNSKQLGGRGHFGLIELTNTGGGELRGTVESEHPCVRVSPTRFEGNEVRVVYQVDPSDMPSTGRIGLTINTQDERVVLRLDRLVPSSWWRERDSKQALAMLLSPTLVYAVWVFLLLAVFLGPTIEKEFIRFGLQRHIESLPWKAHLRAWLFAILAILPGSTCLPALQKWLYSKLDFSVQEEVRWALIPAMMMPTLVVGALFFGTNYWDFSGMPDGRLPLLGSRFIILGVTFGLNLLATALFHTQTTTWWEEHQESNKGKKWFLAFWAATFLLGVVATFFMW